MASYTSPPTHTHLKAQHRKPTVRPSTDAADDDQLANLFEKATTTHPVYELHELSADAVDAKLEKLAHTSPSKTKKRKRSRSWSRSSSRSSRSSSRASSTATKGKVRTKKRRGNPTEELEKRNSAVALYLKRQREQNRPR
jgi:hypothetical protein